LRDEGRDYLSGVTAFRTAVPSSFGSFIEAAHKATAQAGGTANALQSSAKDVSAKALSFTEANLKAAFDHAQKLIQAKDPQEILAHQSENVKKQLAAMEGACEALRASSTLFAVKSRISVGIS
jgi:hypothetical protein